jgi:hypothetical protein
MPASQFAALAYPGKLTANSADDAASAIQTAEHS